MRGSSSSTAGRPTETLGIDPGNPTGFALVTWFGTEQEKMLAASKVRENPVPYADRLAFWQRVKARRAEKQAQREREDQDISMWLAEKAPTPVELWAQEAIDGATKWQIGPASPLDEWLQDVENFKQIEAGSVTSDHLRAGFVSWDGNAVLKDALSNLFEPVPDRDPNAIERARQVHINRDRTGSVNQHDMHIHVGTKAHEDMELYRQAIRTYGTRPHLPGHRRELEVLKLQDVDEVDWDVATMIDAHRNNCTALDDQRLDITVPLSSPPIYAEVATYLFDPRHEMGPRQRNWHRQNRNQPVNKPRSKRRGKR